MQMLSLQTSKTTFFTIFAFFLAGSADHGQLEPVFPRMSIKNTFCKLKFTRTYEISENRISHIDFSQGIRNIKRFLPKLLIFTFCVKDVFFFSPDF